jgi:uncharacterized protein (TIGR02147 family)
MDLREFRDYKEIVRERIKELKVKQPAMSLKRVAEKIPIQYTYLSKVMNSPDHHLSEDDVFRLSEILEFSGAEVEYFLLVHEMQSARLPSRKRYLETKVEALRRERAVRADEWEGGQAALAREMAYFLDPACLLVWVAVTLERYRQDPRRLAPLLGISEDRLREILQKLEAMQLVELGRGGLSVTRVLKSHVHFSKSHPLMRTHQHLVRMMLQDRVLHLSESDKESFQVTFTSSAKALDEIRGEFRKFITRVEELSRARKSEQLYQLSFDLARWG